jgi:hypothetical protein
MTIAIKSATTASSIVTGSRCPSRLEIEAPLE